MKKNTTLLLLLLILFGCQTAEVSTPVVQETSVATLPTESATELPPISEPTTPPLTADEQAATRIVEELRNTQPPARPAPDTLCSDAVPSDIYDEFNQRYAAWVATVVQSGDLTPLRDNQVIYLESGDGPVLASFLRAECQADEQPNVGMHFTGSLHLMVVNSDGSHQLLDDVTSYPAQAPPSLRVD